MHLETVHWRSDALALATSPKITKNNGVTHHFSKGTFRSSKDDMGGNREDCRSRVHFC